MIFNNPALPPENYTSGPKMEAYQYQEKMLGIDLPPDVAKLVDPHWLSFTAPTSTDHFILGFVYFFIFVAGLFGNGLVLWVFSTSKNLRTSSNLFVANLAVLDLVMMAQLPIFVANSLYQGQVLGTIGCALFGFLGGVAGMGAAVNNVAIAYDRYRSISNPLDGRLTMKKATILVVLVWVWATPFSILPLLEIWNRFIPEGYLTTCSFDYLSETQDVKVFTMCIFVYAYCIPVSMLVFFYSRILGHVREHQKMLSMQAQKMGVKSLASGADEKSAEIKIAKVACGIFFLFLAAWTPYATVALTGAFHSNRAVLTPFASMLPAVFSKTVACIDPWVYAISHPKFREQIHKRLPWLISAEKNFSDAGSVVSSNTTVDANAQPQA